MKQMLLKITLVGCACVWLAAAGAAQTAAPRAAGLTDETDCNAQDPKPPKAPKTPKPTPAPKAPKAKPAPRAPAPFPDDEDEDENQIVSRHSITAEKTVIVSLSLLSGDIKVRGWDKAEVSVEAKSSGRVLLERADGLDDETPAKKIEVALRRNRGRELAHGDGFAGFHGGDGTARYVTLDVPKGATVYLRTINGDVRVDSVAEADAQAVNGDVRLENISRFTKASTPNGDVRALNLKGRVELSALSGDLSVADAAPLEANDLFRASATSGEISLENITHANVMANSVSGEIFFAGKLARGGSYIFVNTAGDITLLLPADSSFKISAKTVYGSISADFAIRGELSEKDAKQGKLVGTHGKGEAVLKLESFNGTIFLRKQ